MADWELVTFCWGFILLIASTPRTITQRVFAFRPLVFLGGLCYDLYLLHHLVEHHVTHEFAYHLRGLISGEAEMILSWLITILFTAVVAWFSFTYFEKPIVRAGRRWLVSLRAEKRRHEPRSTNS
ncbi:hypothetical protein BH10BDE1_BH10BDE1_23910 [soil metagenome]